MEPDLVIERKHLFLRYVHVGTKVVVVLVVVRDHSIEVIVPTAQLYYNKRPVGLGRGQRSLLCKWLQLAASVPCNASLGARRTLRIVARKRLL